MTAATIFKARFKIVAMTIHLLANESNCMAMCLNRGNATLTILP